MIVGFDHLALNFKSLKSAREFIKNNDYKVLFSESNIPNHKSKKKLINNYKNQHSLIYCQHKNGFKLELTIYGDNKNINFDSYQTNSNNPRNIIMLSNNLEDDLILMNEKCNFIKQLVNNNDYKLTLKTIISSLSCKIILKKSLLDLGTSKLDSIGYTCIAFLTTSLNEDMDQLGKFGAYDLSEAHTLKINNKTLLIQMFRFPGGAIGELIQPLKKF